MEAHRTIVEISGARQRDPQRLGGKFRGREHTPCGWKQSLSQVCSLLVAQGEGPWGRLRSSQ